MYHSDYLTYRALSEEYEARFIATAEEYFRRVKWDLSYCKVTDANEKGCEVTGSDGYDGGRSIFVTIEATKNEKAFDEWCKANDAEPEGYKYAPHIEALARVLIPEGKFPAFEINGQNEEGVFIIGYERNDPNEGINYFVSYDLSIIENIYDNMKRRDAKK